MAASMIEALRGLARSAFVAAAAVTLTIAQAGAASAQAVLRDAEIEETLHAYGEPLFRAAGLNPDDIQIHLVDDDTLNAFVSGGQHMYIHTGLIMESDTPNELIGVMAHETGHIAGGHLARSREAMQRSMGPALISIGLGVLALVGGAPDAGAALIAGSQQFAMGNYVRHTQVQESAADQAAMQYLEATGQSGQGLIDFFNKNLRPYEFMMRRAPPYLLTHPFSSDRVESMRTIADRGSHHDDADNAEALRRFAFMQAKLFGFLRSQGQVVARYPASDTSQPARYARAFAYYRVSDLVNARRELDSLIAEDPNNPYFQELMGQILFENGRAQESIAHHRRSLELSPNQPLLQINLARALTSAGGRDNNEEAVRVLQAALQREPDNAFGWRELAQARAALGEEALAELASAEQNFAIGNYGMALNFAERARRTLPRNTPAYQRANDIVTFAGSEVHDQQRAERR